MRLALNVSARQQISPRVGPASLSPANTTAFIRNSYLMARQALSVSRQAGFEAPGDRATYVRNKLWRLHQFQNALLVHARFHPASAAESAIVKAYLAAEGVGFRGMRNLLQQGQVLKVETRSPPQQQKGIVTLALLNGQGALAGFATGIQQGKQPLQIRAASPLINERTAAAYVPSAFIR